MPVYELYVQIPIMANRSLVNNVDIYCNVSRPNFCTLDISLVV